MRIIFICLHLTLPASASSSHTPNNSMSLGLPVWHQPQHPSTTVLLSLLYTCPGIIYFIVVIPKHHVLGTLLLICIKWFSVVTNENFSLNSFKYRGLKSNHCYDLRADGHVCGRCDSKWADRRAKRKKKKQPKIQKHRTRQLCSSLSAQLCETDVRVHSAVRLAGVWHTMAFHVSTWADSCWDWSTPSSLVTLCEGVRSSSSDTGSCAWRNPIYLERGVRRLH